MTFRFDDLSINTDLDNLLNLLTVIWRREPEAEVYLAISPVVFSKDQLPLEQQQRVHPRILTAGSSIQNYYRGQSCGIPKVPADERIRRAGHGIVHVDHRLLSRETQELSIVVSCSLVDAGLFIPPYNKWNRDTESICQEHGLDLVRFEDGWRHVLHNRFDPRFSLYYMHPYDLTPKALDHWFAS